MRRPPIPINGYKPEAPLSASGVKQTDWCLARSGCSLRNSGLSQTMEQQHSHRTGAGIEIRGEMP